MLWRVWRRSPGAQCGSAHIVDRVRTGLCRIASCWFGWCPWSECRIPKVERFNLTACPLPPARGNRALGAQALQLTTSEERSEPASEVTAGRRARSLRSSSTHSNPVRRGLGDRGPHHAVHDAKERRAKGVNCDPRRNDEGGSQGGNGVPPGKQNEPPQRPRREPPSEPPAGIAGTSSLLALTPPGSAPPRLRNRTRTALLNGSSNRQVRWARTGGFVGLERAGLLGSRALRRAALCWLGRGLGRGDRNLSVTPAGGSDGDSRWGLWCGLVCLLRVHPSPSSASPSSQARQGRIHPLGSSFLCVDSMRGAVLGHGNFLNGVSLRDPLQKVAATCGGFARRLDTPVWSTTLARSTGALSRPELGSLAGGGRLSV